jgi:hypothetical protein
MIFGNSIENTACKKKVNVFIADLFSYPFTLSISKSLTAKSNQAGNLIRKLQKTRNAYGRHGCLRIRMKEVSL